MYNTLYFESLSKGVSVCNVAVFNETMFLDVTSSEARASRDHFFLIFFLDFN